MKHILAFSLALTIATIGLFGAAGAQTTKVTTTTIKISNTTDTSAVSDTTIKETRQDTVRIGNITIIQCHDCNDGNTNTSVHFGSDKNKKKHTLQPVKVSWWGFELGLNNFVDKSNYGTPEVNDFVHLGNAQASDELFSLRAIKSVNVNIWPVWVKASIIKHVLNLKTGIGVEMNNYRYTKNITYVDAADGTYIKRDDVHFTKNKLFTEYLTIPVMLNLDTNPYHNSNAFRLSAGPTFGYLIKSRTKQISSELGKQKNNSSFNLEKFRTGLRAEIGYGPISLYGAYSFTPIHKSGLNQYPFSIGIELIGSRGW